MWPASSISQLNDAGTFFTRELATLQARSAKYMSPCLLASGDLTGITSSCSTLFPCIESCASQAQLILALSCQLPNCL